MVAVLLISVTLIAKPTPKSNHVLNVQMATFCQMEYAQNQTHFALIQIVTEYAWVAILVTLSVTETVLSSIKIQTANNTQITTALNVQLVSICPRGNALLSLQCAPQPTISQGSA